MKASDRVKSFMRLTSILLAVVAMLCTDNLGLTQTNNGSEELLFSAPPVQSQLPRFNSFELQYFWNLHNLKAYAPLNRQEAVYKYFDRNNNGFMENEEELEMLSYFKDVKVACKKLQQQAQPLPGENQVIGLHIY
jgi:hypothetical protein